MLGEETFPKAGMGILLKEVSVIVSTYTKSRFRYVVGCIESLIKQSLPPKEIILVLDPDQELMQFYRSCIPSDVKIILSEACGLSNARNAGVENAEGEIVAFIDDDAIADRDWLKNLVGNYEDILVLGCGGLIKPLWEGRRPIWFPEELDWIVGCSYKGLPESKANVRNPIGCNMSFRKDVFDKVGYFRTNIGRFGSKLIANEETEFSIRILGNIAGSKMVYDPSAVVYHRVPRNRANLGYLLKRSFYEGLSKAIITDFKSNPSKALSTEDRYLRYLLKVAILSRLKRIHRLECIHQSLGLLLSVSVVLTGYFFGKYARPKWTST